MRTVDLVFLVIACAPWSQASDLLTFFGGSGQDFGSHVAADASGNIFLSGSTLSFDLPQTGVAVAMGPPTPKTCFLSAAFSYDCTEPVSFIAKLNPNGSALLYSAYFGGPSNITGMIADAAGDLYLTGTTGATNFPTTKGAYETTPAQSQSGFVSKISPDASTLVFSTFVDGTPGAIALDSGGNVVVGGATSAGAFVLKLAADGSHPLFGQSLNIAMSVASIALDSAGNVVVAGQGANSPLIAKLNASGIIVLPPTPALMGLGAVVNSMCLDSGGNIYLAGSITGATSATYGAHSGAADAFVAKFDTAGAKLLYFAYLGGSGQDSANSIAVDASGNVYVAGATLSRDFPVTAFVALRTVRRRLGTLPSRCRPASG